MEGASPGHGRRRGRTIKILAAAAVAVVLAAAGATVLVLHTRPAKIPVHVLPVGQDMDSATAIAVDGPDVWVANETDRWGGSVTELDASDGRLVRTLSAPRRRDPFPDRDRRRWRSPVGRQRQRLGDRAERTSPGLVAAVGTHIWVFGRDGVRVLTDPAARPGRGERR